MTPYERRVLKDIHGWQKRAPGWGTRVLAVPGRRLADAMELIVPPSALRKALQAADRAGRQLADQRSILKQAGVATTEELRALPLQTCDRLARSVSRRAMLLGGGSGALFGVAGAFGLVADVPALLTLALRTVHRMAYCYGIDDELAERLGLIVFALASANSAKEKNLALDALRAVDAEKLDAAWRDGVERIAQREMAKEATVYSLQNLARTIGVNLGQRKIAGGVPVIGMAIGAAVNANYVSDIAEAAQQVFRERWLRGRYADLIG